MKRQAFLGSSAGLIAAAFLRDVSLATGVDSVATGLVPLVETVLPFGAPTFPSITSAEVVQRINGLFKLDESPIFQGSVRGFSLLALFPAGAEQLFAAERAVSPAADIQVLVKKDAAAFAASGLSTTAIFQDLNAADKATYLRLWSHSAFSTRRRFYGSVRAVTLVAFYSLPESWPAIGYAGPILKGNHA